MTGAPAVGRDLAELDLADLYAELRALHGPQHSWWPARTAFEMMVGSVLVQNTRWQNVQMSIERLREADALEPRVLVGIEQPELERLIHSSGFQKAKSAALHELSAWVLRDHADHLSNARLRDDLLALRGIGHETADVIALYAYGRPAFIADAYARRLLVERGFAVPGSYEPTRRRIAPALERSGLDTSDLAELHGLIVEEGKRTRSR